MEAGGVPTLPVWLSPTQIRVIPLSENYVDHCVKLAERLAKQEIRVDVDDRSESMGKKIRDAEREWIPYIIVVGEREKNTGKVNVRVRGEKQQRTVVPEVVAVEVKEKAKGRPFRRLPLPMLLSERPTFVG
jgi:threonyl-tRNA synthetase